MLRPTVTATVSALFFLLLSAVGQNDRAAPPPSTSARPRGQLQDFSHAVVPITAIKLRGPFVRAEFASGFCLDPECQFIGTNYHVAATIKHLRIKGAKVVDRFLATGPNDRGATLNYLASGAELRFTWCRDLAVFQLAKPLRNYHGLQFSTDEPQIGEQVAIYAYPKGTVNPFRDLQEFHGTFEGEDAHGLLMVDYVPTGDHRLRPGASGGIVVDIKTGKVVGIFCALPEVHEATAFAVPVESLAEFLDRTQPFLAGLLFPIRTEASADQQDLYPAYEPQHVATLQRRTDLSVGSNAVSVLRERAQSLAEGMRDFVAVQTYVWGSGSDHIEAADAYEVQVRDGSQRFREYPSGKKWRWEPATPEAPAAGVTPADEWSTLPLYIGTNTGVEIREAPPAVVRGHRVRVFQYLGSVEDEPCRTRDVYDFLLFAIHRDVNATPYGEVWTDKHENIVRMSLHCQDHAWGWSNSKTVVTYGWLNKPGLAPRLVPVTIIHEASRKDKLYWCRGRFVNYREFVSRARIVAANRQ